MAKSYRELIAWQKSMDLVTVTYQATNSFPKHELFGLTSQMRRAAVSIPSNIAEGHGRSKHVDRCHFLYMARGSSLELQTQAEIANRLGYLAQTEAGRLEAKAAEVGRILNGLLKALGDENTSLALPRSLKTKG